MVVICSFGCRARVHVCILHYFGEGGFLEDVMIIRGLGLIIFICFRRLRKFDFFFNYRRNHALVVNCFFILSNERIGGFLLLTFTASFFIILFRNPIVDIVKVGQLTLMPLISNGLDLHLRNFLIFLNAHICSLFQFAMLNAKVLITFHLFVFVFVLSAGDERIKHQAELLREVFGWFLIVKKVFVLPLAFVKSKYVLATIHLLHQG